MDKYNPYIYIFLLENMTKITIRSHNLIHQTEKKKLLTTNININLPLIFSSKDSLVGSAEKDYQKKKSIKRLLQVVHFHYPITAFLSTAEINEKVSQQEQ